MCFRASLILGAMLPAGMAHAQTGVSGRNGQKERPRAVPAATSSWNDAAARLLPGTAGTANSPFHFSEKAKRGPAYNPPPQASDKAAVMGQQRPWQNGRPLADCALEPRDPACR
jgi:hypothetical protein